MVKAINSKSKGGKSEGKFPKPLSDKTVKAMKEKQAGKASLGEATNGKVGKGTTYDGGAKGGGLTAGKVDVPKMKDMDLEVEIYQGARRMTVEQAKAIIGWQVAGENEPFKLRDGQGNKVKLTNNSTNRPFRPGLAKRYMSDMLRRKWFLNGETIVVDCKGKVQSGQHRIVGLILAEEQRKGKEKERWARYWKGPVVMDAIVVRGISDKSEVINTLDIGQKRSFGDNIYRDGTFTAEDGKGGVLKVLATDKVIRQLSNILAGGVRLCWLRAGGRTVSDAPHFPLSEAMQFLYDHPRLKDFTLFIYNLEGGVGVNGGRLTRYLSMAYAAGLCYLMATSGTDPAEWSGAGASAINFNMEKKAKQFWEKFASGAELKADDPIFVAREMLPKIDAGSSMGRDEIVSIIIKAFNLWSDGTKCKQKDLVVKRIRDDKGKEKLAEDPRLGGIDIEGADRPADSLGEADYDESEAAAQKNPELDEREGSKSGKIWAEGDTAWVKDDSGNHWFGTVQRFHKGEGVPDSVDIIGDDDGKEWNEDAVRLSVKFPK